MRIPLSLAAMALTLGFAAPVFAQAGPPPTDPGSAGIGGPTMMSITVSPAAAAAPSFGMAQPAPPSGPTGNGPSSVSDRTAPRRSRAPRPQTRSYTSRTYNRAGEAWAAAQPHR